MTDALDGGLEGLVPEIVAGRVVPFLGAGVNLCGRPAGETWKLGRELPNGKELAEYLAEVFGYSEQHPESLTHVGQYVSVMAGSGPLYEEIRRVFDNDFEPSPVHRLLASVPELLRGKGYPARHQLIVTTNYDDVLERSFSSATEPFDVVTYMAEGALRGKFVHQPPDGVPIAIERPNEYRGLSTLDRSVILKIHGAVNRVDSERDSYVITEDNYIDYLARSDISNLVPVTIAAKLRRSHFLFLGYSLRDWNLRVILHRIWGEQKLSYRSWAVRHGPEPLEREYWAKRDVKLFDAKLEDYIATLAAALQSFGQAPIP
jgi:SIR2-like domain